MSHTIHIKLYDTDAAGLLFYGALFRLFQDEFERRIAEHGFSIQKMMADGLAAVVRHCDAEYLAPIRVSEELEISSRTQKRSERSLQIEYTLSRGEEAVARGSVLHICLDTKKGEAIPWPEDFAKIWD